MRVVKIKNGWNTSDSMLVINNRMMEMGLSAYWDAVDTTFAFNSKRREVFLAKKAVQDNSCVDGKPMAKYNSAPMGADPMPDFFRRKRIIDEECQRDAQEDRHCHDSRCGWDSGRSDHSRFWLPRPHDRHY